MQIMSNQTTLFQAAKIGAQSGARYGIPIAALLIGITSLNAFYAIEFTQNRHQQYVAIEMMRTAFRLALAVPVAAIIGGATLAVASAIPDSFEDEENNHAVNAAKTR